MKTKQELENTIAAASKAIETATLALAQNQKTLAENEEARKWASEELRRFMYIDEILGDCTKEEVEGNLVVKNYHLGQMKKRFDLGELSMSLRVRGVEKLVLEVGVTPDQKISLFEISWIDYADPDNADPVWWHGGGSVSLVNIPPLLEWRLIKND
ncbi:MAG: hypothetical protein WC750_04410 [Patescibacteria group bacterium]|jgi:hypothetical protein